MGYSMRFYDATLAPLHLAEVRQALRDRDINFEIDGGFLLFAGELYAELEITEPDDRYFDWQANSLRSEFADAAGIGRAKVESVLRTTKRMLLVRVLSGGREPELTFSRLDVLWDWLFTNRSGLLHAEGEGFYDGEELILIVK